jgi:hypothetical protein
MATSLGRRVVLLGGIGLVAFAARIMLDWRWVYSEFIPASDIGTAALSMAFYLATVAAWTWALLAAADGRRSGFLALALLAGVMLVGQGAATWVAFCPFPCQTAWPLGEGINTSGVLVGLVVLVAAFSARRGAAST